MIKIQGILEVEKYIDDVDAVIFDLDDTLYSEKDYIRSGYHQIAEAFHIPEMEKEMWSVFEHGGKAIDEVLEKHNLRERKQEALNIYRFQEPNISLYPGVLEMLTCIASKKKVGIITDGRPEGQHAKIRVLKLKSVIPAIIVTDELGGTEYRKPNPEAFIRMSEILETQLDRMVYIGDNIKKDFIAPERLGMKTIYFRNAEGLYYER